MQKIIKFWKAIWLLLQRPALLNYILKDEEVLQKEFKRKFPHLLLQQLDAFSWPEAQHVNVSPVAFLSGSSLLTDFAFLQLLCTKYKVETYLEIGTWRGESVANVAPYVKEAYTMNLPDQTLQKMGQSQAYIDSHRFFSKDLSNVTHLFGDSTTYDWKSFEGACDLIFIDGDHSTEGVFKDTQTALRLRKKESSILVWHDAKSDAEYPRYEVLLGIYSALPKEMHRHIYLVKHSLCAVYLPNVQRHDPVLINALPTRFFKVNWQIQQLN